mmetsp:Transcript_69435/g.136296  ORF Transcript_69435/g.136296 Transcript_69435/m.136296 type:complete len:231 (+) Transcript_69435:52-744(+)
MAPKVYTMLISQPARALSWACAFEGTEVEEVQVMPGKDTKKPEYLAANPIPTVPRLEEDGFVLNESHAIMCYLGDKHNWKLYPRDARMRARIHQYMNWHHQNTRRITLALFAPVVRTDLAFPKDMLDDWKKNITSPMGTLSTIETWLSSSKWLCGDQPTVADLSCYCEIAQCCDQFTGIFAINGIDLAPYPRIRAWLAACEQLPGHDQSHALLKKMSSDFKKAAQLRSKL